ncbi:unnamed protein product [Protopolystoma xenopodis]|uniref:Dynein heavy chain C-terminal domain-containing protein n=1 Tax=Protopolystoma xenopodis TaxID=117903 RepID=A0A3S5CVE5_9PLAT|nr:unnamed protein product [Protopolystoma xenopodis]
MNHSLTILKRALVGEAVMSSELDDLAKCLYNGHLPGEWRRLAPATLKSLANWILHFKARVQQYTSWVGIVLDNIFAPCYCEMSTASKLSKSAVSASIVTTDSKGQTYDISLGFWQHGRS